MLFDYHLSPPEMPVVLGVLNALPNVFTEGDFADALNERDEAYANYHAAQAAKDN
ncbi:hypothetical protein QNL30_25495 [Pseudomonas amygdali pv. morsprunorum]|uniref:Uncharacterized protein n=1 Tax=Pseudomonas amygdali pv. morsprunorum TaxID=129138 RepID=A0AB35R6F0_PSEA0|nr:hypothetical protein [Pseudomonas amygdali]MDT3243932.1 hypothetical protein [Pseudomonas amygdali pv. morsprunorum]